MDLTLHLTIAPNERQPGFHSLIVLAKTLCKALEFGNVLCLNLGVLPLAVVDNSVFSPISLTVHTDPPYYQEALSFSHFRQRGSLWLFMCIRSYSCSSSSSRWCCFGVFTGIIFSLPTYKQAADAPRCTVCSSHAPRLIVPSVASAPQA
jgi:hypothetical protein